MAEKIRIWGIPALILKWCTATRLRKILSSILAILMLITSIRFIFLRPKVALAADVYLGLNEGYGTSTNDSIKTITAPTINGATWQQENMCVIGKCLYFDGTNDWINLGSTDLARNTSAVTLETWFRATEDVTGYRSLIQISINSGSSTTTSRAYLELVNNNAISAGGRSPDSQGAQLETTSNNVFVPNQWYHIAAVINYATDDVDIFLNGVERTTTGVATFTNSTSDNTVSSYGAIGAEDNGGSVYFKGFLDEIKIYSSARTVDQIKADFTGETLSRGTSASFGPDQSYISDGLVGYWKLDESSGNATDYSGNGNTLTNNGTTTYVGAKYGKGSEHVPASNQYLSASSGTQSTYYLDGSDAVAYDPNNVWTNDSNAFDSDSTPSTYAQTASLGNLSQNYLAAEGTNAPTSGNSISSVDVRFYGSLNNSGATWTGYSTLTTPSGGWTWAKVAGLETKIIYTVPAMGDGEIYAYIYEDGGVNLIGWPSLYNAVGDVTGEVYKIEFRVTETGSAINNVGSVSFWTNPDSNTNYYVSLSSGAYITSSSGTLSATGFTNPKYYVNGVESSTITANTWQLVTVTSDSGITADQVYIGRQGTNYYDGTLDEVRFYNRKLSPSEIQKLYNWAPGPVGYWKMDENAGTSVIDYSGNGNNGTMSGTSLGAKSWRPGKFGSALLFGGDTTDDQVSAGDPANGLFDFGATDSFSVSFWTKISPDVVQNQAPVSKGGAPGWRFRHQTTDQMMYFQIRDGVYSPNATTNSAVADDRWHHIEGVRDVANDTVNIYMDGVLQQSATDTTTAGFESASNLIISDFADEVRGLLDDVKIYNYARSPSQVVEDMNANHPAPGSPVGSAIGYWKFDEGADNTCSDGTNDICNAGSGGSALDGTKNSMSVPATSTSGWTNSGVFSKALNFDDTDDFLSIPYASLPTGDFTASAWINYQGASDTILSIHTTSGTDELKIRESSNNIIVTAHGTTVITSAATLSSSTWYHIAVTRSGSSILLYINGKQDANTGSYGTAFTYNCNLLIGIDTDNACATPTYASAFKGSIDEVSIYSSALTEDQIELLYNQGAAEVMGSKSTSATGNASWSAQREFCPPGNTETNCASGQDPSPVGHWNFDENTGSTTYERTGSGSDPTFYSSSPSWASGNKTGALHFDGVDDAVRYPDGASQSLVITGNLTISAWVYRETTNTDDGIIGLSGSGALESGNQVYSLYINDTDSKLRMDWQYGTGVWETSIASSVALTNTSNKWIHVAAVRNSTAKTVTFYENGVQLGTPVSYTNNPTGGTNLPDLDISYNGADYFDGRIDDIKVFNYIRTPAQIAWDYNQGDPVGWWKMDETSWNGTANEVKDSSGNAFHGVRSGNATTTTGKYNNAGTFDGTGDYVTTSNPTALQLSTTGTVAAWIKWSSSSNPSPPIVCKGDWTNDRNGYCLAGYGGGIDGELANATAQLRIHSTNTNYRDNSWHHAVLTWDGTWVNLYVDGSLAATPVSQDLNPLSTSYNLYIGSDTTNYDYFYGLIDDVRIYNYALSPQQVKLIYNGGAALRFAPPTGTP